LNLTADGMVESLVIDVGSFLRMGEKPVLLKPDHMEIRRDANGNDLRVYLAMTKGELEAMPTYGT
jgi:hypothetical protein